MALGCVIGWGRWKRTAWGIERLDELGIGYTGEPRVYYGVAGQGKNDEEWSGWQDGTKAAVGCLWEYLEPDTGRCTDVSGKGSMGKDCRLQEPAQFGKC
jgi:hypothetical protein